jgi:hypothetical protein
MSANSYVADLPAAIYVWLVPSEHMLDQPGSWRIRKWDIEPFPEANFTLRSGPLVPHKIPIPDSYSMGWNACVDEINRLNATGGTDVR